MSKQLRKALTKTDVLTMAFGAMIGWGWVVLPGEWITNGGIVGSSLAFLLGSFMCLTVGQTYAELTSAFPYAGGQIMFVYNAFGRTWAWITGWSITFAYLNVSAWESIAIVKAIDYIVPLPQKFLLWKVAGSPVYLSEVIIGIAFACLVTYTNYRGIEASARFQTIATLILVAAGGSLIITSLVKGDSSNLEPVWTSADGFFTVLMMVPFLFVGFDVIPQSAEEMNIDYSSAGKLLILSIICAVIWYVAITMAISLASPAVRTSSGIVAAEAMESLLHSKAGGAVIALGGVCGILTSWNAFFMSASRSLFAMGRMDMLPQAFTKLHSKYGSPVFPTVLVGLITTCAPLLGSKALLWFVNAGGLGTTIAYFLVSASFLRLRRTKPEIARPYKVENWRLVGYAALVSTIIFIILYLPVGPSALVWPYEWGIILAWSLIGLFLFLVRRQHQLVRVESDYTLHES